MTTLDDRYLRRRTRPSAAVDDHPLVAVDLFAGCGGLTVGLSEAARRADRRLDVPLAVDLDPVMASTFRRNIPGAGAVAASVESIFSGDPGDPFTSTERNISKRVADIDFLCGGPPCQGHSDLNNHTRRNDSRNRLYLRMARAADVLRPAVVIVENVPAVAHDADGVVDETVRQLKELGYRTHVEVVDLADAGVPQRRRRHLLVATRLDDGSPEEAVESVRVVASHRSVSWAIRDLAKVAGPGVLDTASSPSAENQRRMRYLLDHDLYDLPDAERPPCHRDKAHSYRAMYGRLWWTRPSPTITTGFGSMGQGRFMHPEEMRTLTPHEAARLQTFPDWFDWGEDTRRGRLATMIGNAVPPLLTVRLGAYWIPKLHRQ